MENQSNEVSAVVTPIVEPAPVAQSVPDSRALAEQVANLNKALEEARVKAREAEGLRQKLSDTDAKLTEYQRKEEVRIEAVKAELDSVLSAMPEADRALVPDALDPDQRLALARRLAARLNAAAVPAPLPPRPAGTQATTGASATIVPPGAEAQAKRLGITDPEKVRAFAQTWLRTKEGKAWASGTNPK